MVNLKAGHISNLHCNENPNYVFPEMKRRCLVPNSYINRDQKFILDSHRPFICSVKLESFYQRGLDPGSFKNLPNPQPGWSPVDNLDWNPVDNLDWNPVDNLDWNPVDNLDWNPVDNLDWNPVDNLDWTPVFFNIKSWTGPHPS
jgi:hypothetical protein